MIFIAVIIQSVQIKVKPSSMACRSSSERTTGNWGSHNADHSRRMLVGGFRVTWDTYIILYGAYRNRLHAV
jgi:hypothetical protein